jgi:hypothetical protein
MSMPFSSSENLEQLSQDVASLKIMLTFILRSMSQVEAGKAILNMESYLTALEDGPAKTRYSTILQEVKIGYLM